MKHPRFGPLILAISYLFLAGSASAHPGHGLFERGAAHVLSSPFHLLLLALIGAGLFLAAKLVRSPKLQQLMRMGGAAVILLSVLIGTFNH